MVEALREGALTKYLIHLPDIRFKAVEIDDEKVAGGTFTRKEGAPPWQ